MVVIGFLLTALALAGYAFALYMVSTKFRGSTPIAVAPVEVAEAPAASPGVELFQTKTCFTCHGADGKTPILPEYPKIAGQNADYVLQQMRDIKGSARSNGQSVAMTGVMHLVSDEELVILADYIAGLPPDDTGLGTDPDSEGAGLFMTKTCFTCHGADGKTPLLSEYPKIAGQNAKYILQQAKDIKSGARDNGQTAAMKGVMHLVSDEELEILAEYISGSTLGDDTDAGGTPGTGTDAAAELPPGEELFKTKTCFTCHGADGAHPLLPEYPEIAGQNAQYVLQQSRDIKSGSRSNGQTAAMKGVMHLVSDQELEILAEYIASLPPNTDVAGADPESEGANLFMTKTCFTCHGADGKTPLLPEYPKIAGHNMEYALQQIMDIKSGARDNGQTAAMKGVMHLVDDNEIRILAEYLATMEP